MRSPPLILVVGPSGAGKDSMINGALAHFSGAAPFHVAKRIITRNGFDNTEDHQAVTPDDFRAMKEAGDFLLSWEAHGLSYAIPASVEDWRRKGVSVVANVSRSVIDDCRRRLSPVGVIVVTAPIEILTQRIVARGRESNDDIKERLEKAALSIPQNDDVRIVQNNGSFHDGVTRFIKALRSLQAL